MKYKLIFNGKVNEQAIRFKLKDEFDRDAELIETGIDDLSNSTYAIVDFDSTIPKGVMETLSVKGVQVADVLMMREAVNLDIDTDKEDLIEIASPFRVPGTQTIVMPGTFKVTKSQ